LPCTRACPPACCARPPTPRRAWVSSPSSGERLGREGGGGEVAGGRGDAGGVGVHQLIRTRGSREAAAEEQEEAAAASGRTGQCAGHTTRILTDPTMA
jgi:hypothetical protein